jgi:hypothetical protein
VNRVEVTAMNISYEQGSLCTRETGDSIVYVAGTARVRVERTYVSSLSDPRGIAGTAIHRQCDTSICIIG